MRTRGLEAVLTVVFLSAILCLSSAFLLLTRDYTIHSSGSIRYAPDTGTLVVKTYYNGTEMSGITVDLTYPNGSVNSVVTPYTLATAAVGTYTANATYEGEQKSDSVYVGAGETKYIQLSWGGQPPLPSIPKYGVVFWAFEEPTTVYDDELKAVFQDLANAGPMWIRFDWLNPPEPFGLIAWKNDMIAMGHKPLAILDAITMRLEHVEPHRDTFTLQDWIDEVTIAVNSAPDIPAWEIWNEPDLPEYQAGYMDGSPQHYMDMLIAAYNIIKGVNSSALVVGPCISCPAYMPWLQSVIDLGLLDYVDAVSGHSYRQLCPNAPLAGSVQAYDEVIQGRKPIWITETGYSTVYGEEDIQKQVLEEDLNPNGVAAQIADVLFWHVLMDQTFGGFEGSLGLVKTDYTPKLAYNSFRSLLVP